MNLRWYVPGQGTDVKRALGSVELLDRASECQESMMRVWGASIHAAAKLGATARVCLGSGPWALTNSRQLKPDLRGESDSGGGFEQLHLDHTVAFLSKALWIYTTSRDTTFQE